MSNQENFIISLDIGTSKVRVMIGEWQAGSLHVIGVGAAESNGMKKGSIIDIDQTVEAIQQAVQQAEQMVDVKIEEVCVGVSGNHVELTAGHGVVAVSSEDREISSTDVERVLQAAKLIALPPDREILNVVPEEFIVDGLGGIQDPRGMIGVRLEVNATIVTTSKTSMHNLSRCISRAGLKPVAYILASLAVGEVVLSRDEKNMGVVTIDFGAGATSISVFNDGQLAAVRVLSIGGDLITNDISIGLRTQTEAAERLKVSYGHAIQAEASEEIAFQVPRIGSQLEKTFTQNDLSSIIEPRVQEIFQIVRQELVELGHLEPAGGFVFLGGVVSLPGFVEMGQAFLGGSVRVAVPEFAGMRDPSYVSGAGLIRYAANHTVATAKEVTLSAKGRSPERRKRGGGAFEKVKNWLSEFI